MNAFTVVDGIKVPTNVQVLTGNESKRNEGNFVLQSQTVAAAEGFRNVSKLWYDKTVTFEQALEELEKGKAATQDISATVAEMVPSVNAAGQFVFLHKPTGKEYRPTVYAMGQVGHWADTGTWFVQNLMDNPTDPKGKQKFVRDGIDAATLRDVIANGFRRVDQKKGFFWRTRNDGSLRAMLTERYAVIDNRWFIERLREFIPGGRVSHWKGDSDTIYANILIPDTIREEMDSEYGGMLSIGNSEIGQRRAGSLPSIFRAICMNGCIWGATKGKGIRQVHRGKINPDTFAKVIKENLQAQIPLLPQGIDRFLTMRGITFDGVTPKVVIAQVAKDSKLGKGQATAVLNAYNTESRLTPDLSNTLFTVVNAITRAGQGFDAAQWVAFDELAGEYVELDKDGFNRVVNRAKSLDVSEVEEMFALN